jgi:O-antigen/teichoic acid export membrane protein
MFGGSNGSFHTRLLGFISMIDRLLDYEINLLGFSMSGRKLVKHPLFSGSAVMIIGSNITNFLAYTYHLIIGRLLGPAPYGVLATMLSLMGLVSTAFSFFGLVIVKFVSSSEENELPGIYHWFKGIIFKFGLLFSGLALLTIPFLTGFLKIDAIILLLLAPMFLISIMVFFYRSILQGLLRFKEVVISTNSDMLGRLLFGLAAYYLGYSVFGVTVGIVMGSFVSLILLRYFIRDKEESKPKSKFKGTKKVFKYSVPVIVTTLSIQSFFSTDLILVKHFFPEHTAGIYASLSNLGKIIFYGTAPVLMVMFPLVSKRHAKGMGYKKIVILSMLLTAGIAGGVTLIYYLYPELMVLMLYGENLLRGRNI